MPAVQEIEGQPVILSDLKPRDQTLLMIYRAGATGISIDKLTESLRLTRKDHLRSRVKSLDEQRLVLEHPTSGLCYVTAKGISEVEKRELAKPL